MIAYLDKNKYRLIELLLAAILTIVVGYYFVSPKAIISNLSDNEYSEFVVSLPTNRISFSPIEAYSTNTIYYSRQNKSGTGTFSLINGEGDLVNGSFLYSAGSELGRELRFTIENTGLVLFSEE
jgi:hypothetical protein